MKQFLLILMASFLCAQNSNTYLGPNKAATLGSVDVQILIYDEKNPSGVQIATVMFDDKSIPLRPRDIYGFRGQGSFKVAPGKYKLKWVVQRSKTSWPHTVAHEEEVTISGRDLWIQIRIDGETASMT